MVSPQPDFNRLITAIRFSEPDRLPLAELWIDAEIKAAFLEDHSGTEFDCRRKGYDLAQDIRFWLSAGYDYLRLSPRYEFFQNWLKDPRCDFAENTANFISSIDYSDLDRVAELLPGGMKVIFAAQGGIYEHAWINIGYENFMMGLFDSPEYIRNVCDSLGEALLAMYTRAAACEHVGGLWLSDDIAYTESLILSPEMIRKYLLPWYERFASLAHENNLPFIFHSDGNLIPLINDLIAIGIDAIHPIEPKAMDVVELKKRVQNKLALFGSVDLDFPLSRGTPSDVIKYVKKRIKEVAPGGGFAIGSSNSITTYVPIENYRAMLDTVMKYGKYPIT